MSLSSLRFVPGFALLGAAVAWAGHAEARADAALLERVRAEYPPALAALERLYLRANASGTLKMFDGPKPEGTPREVYRTSVARDGGLLKIEEIAVERSGRGPYATAYGANERYAFLLEKPAQDASYLLRDVSPPTAGKRSRRSIRSTPCFSARAPRSVNASRRSSRGPTRY